MSNFDFDKFFRDINLQPYLAFNNSTQYAINQISNILSNASLIDQTQKTIQQFSRLFECTDPSFLIDSIDSISNITVMYPDYWNQVKRLDEVANIFLASAQDARMGIQYDIVKNTFPHKNGFLSNSFRLSPPQSIAINGLIEGVKKDLPIRDALRSTFSGREISDLRDRLSEVSIDDFRRVLVEFLDHMIKISERWSDSVIRRQSTLNYISIALGLVSAIGVFKNTNSQVFNIAEYNDICNSYSVNIEVNQEHIQYQRYYLTLIRKPIREQPSSSAGIIAHLPPNVRLLERENLGEWYYVEYFNDKTGVVELGWVHKNKLMLIEWSEVDYKDI